MELSHCDLQSEEFYQAHSQVVQKVEVTWVSVWYLEMDYSFFCHLVLCLHHCSKQEEMFCVVAPTAFHFPVLLFPLVFAV